MNQKIGIEFDHVLSDARIIKQTMKSLETAEEFNKQIEEKAKKANDLSLKILNKLKKFKENSFRPRI